MNTNFQHRLASTAKGPKADIVVTAPGYSSSLVLVLSLLTSRVSTVRTGVIFSASQQGTTDCRQWSLKSSVAVTLLRCSSSLKLKLATERCYTGTDALLAQVSTSFVSSHARSELCKLMQTVMYHKILRPAAAQMRLALVHGCLQQCSDGLSRNRSLFCEAPPTVSPEPHGYSKGPQARLQRAGPVSRKREAIPTPGRLAICQLTSLANHGNSLALQKTCASASNYDVLPLLPAFERYHQHPSLHPLPQL